ncbi:PBECR4 domain-containing protein [Streptobacillus moniliformis]|uniref:PBECR4 domain-containing protein n=1 Tax=Streptobacillus moniliformis TaxID=34105 RepID=UPI0007E30845|nr:PBECR4 domain-containing protein [Streptobacillus moniliformis]
MKETYKAIETIEYFSQFNKEDIQINSKNKQFNISFNRNGLPHLLGLQYIKEYTTNFNATTFLKEIRENKISDKDILDRVEKYHGEKQRINVENRINTFSDFMKNMEKGFVVKKTLESKMNVNYLVIQSEDNTFKHLGILSGNTGTLIETYDELDVEDLSILKTYFIEHNDDYYKNTDIIEPIENLKIYDDKLDTYINFSFDIDKQRFLNQNLNMEYKECIDEYYKKIENEIIFNNWNTKKDNKDIEIER